MINTIKPRSLVSNYIRHSKLQSTISPNFKTAQSVNRHIANLCKTHLFQKALEAFESLQTHATVPLYPSTYAHLISACSSLRSLKLGRKVHDHIIQSGTRPDIILHNHILNMYGKCGSLDDARKVFDEMIEHNVVSWTCMIAGYSQNLRERTAMEMYIKMRGSGVMPDQFTFGSVIRACTGLNDAEVGKQLHAHVLKFGFGSKVIRDTSPVNALVAMYTKFNQIDSARKIFNNIVCKDLISWGSVIAGFAQLGRELEALELFKEMLSLGGYHPNEYIFGSVLSACSGLLHAEYGTQIHGLSIKFGLGKDVYAGCSLCDLYSKCGSLHSAKKAFYQIENPDLVSWNSIIAAFAYSGDSDESMSLFSRMRSLGFEPDDVTVLCLLCSFTSFDMLYQGKQVHSYVIKVGLDVCVSVCNTLLTMYSQCSGLSDVFNVFYEMKSNVDLISWNSVITSTVCHNQATEACRFLKLMHTSEFKLDNTTLTNVLVACSQLASLESGYQIHDYAIKSGYDVEDSVANGLIDMYTKCGALTDARKVFEAMVNANIVAWSSLIVGYAQSGYGKEALEIFTTMRGTGMKPNHVTFVGVLSACSHVGLVEEGCHYYRTMESDHGVTPTREHCSCMVDMLGRAGYLREAENFIRQMPFVPDILVWKTLLSACRTHGDTEVGKRAAERVLELDPSNSAAYVLLCNIYASTGCWDAASLVRNWMKSRGVKKFPGQSSIEDSNGVHVFSVEDRSHPKMDEIYSILEDLWLHISETGAGCLLDQKVSCVEALQEQIYDSA